MRQGCFPSSSDRRYALPPPSCWFASSRARYTLHAALELALEHSKKSTAVVSLLRKCLAAWEHGTVSALIDLCDESDRLLGFKKYAERYQVHFAAIRATDVAILKPMIREQAPELLTDNHEGLTPLDCATKFHPFPAVVSFMTSIDAAFHNCDHPALIKLCGSTPDWEQKAKNAKDKNDAAAALVADDLAASFF